MDVILLYVLASSTTPFLASRHEAKAQGGLFLLVFITSVTSVLTRQALDEAARLREDNTNLTNQMNEERGRIREERKQFREEAEKLERRAATSEREKAELRESLEESTSQWKTCQEQYGRELRGVRAELSVVRKEIQEYRDKVCIYIFITLEGKVFNWSFYLEHDR